MRSERAIASSWSCVTNRKVMPTSRWSIFSSPCICRRRLASSADSGSSSSSSSGRFTRARASATRCCCPPLNFDGAAPAYALILTMARACSTRWAISAFATPCARNPYATFSKTDRCGKSAYCWKTVLTCRRWGGSRSSRSPPIQISPVSGRSKPAISRSSVVLPEPLSPRMVRNSPGATSSETSRSTVRAPKLLATERI